MSDKGYFIIDRGLLEHPIWTDDKPFCKGAAWVDLIGRANWKTSERMVGAELVRVKRGQLITSEGALAARWGWSKRKVRRFLLTLEAAQMLSKKGTTKGTTLTIENYGKYQLEGTTDGPTKEPQRNHEGTTKEPQRVNTIKKEKKDKEGEEYARTRATPDDGWVVVYDPEEDER